MDIITAEKNAQIIRKEVIKMLTLSGSGHPAGSLGLSDLFAALYFGILNHDPANPLWEDRDRLILSNGHVAPALYAALAISGYFDKSILKTLRKFASPLQGHPERGKLPGVETSSGPLGEGLGQSIGIALSARLDNRRYRVYCITSDGEHNEGSHWEAVMIAVKYKLGNLTLFVDRNNIQIGGTTEEIMPLNPLANKYRSFNWNVVEISGHDIREIEWAVRRAREVYNKPTAVILHTIPGKGVSFMENDYRWHGKAPNKDEGDRALRELIKNAK